MDSFLLLLIVFNNVFKIILNVSYAGWIFSFSSNLIATVLGGFILYFFFEKRIKEKIKSDEIIKSLKNLAGDLTYNFVRAQKAIEREAEYLNSDRFTISRYRTEKLLSFYYEKPILEVEKFPYISLLGLITKFEDSNTLSELVFGSNNNKALRENKEMWFKNAKKIKKEIVDFLNAIEPFYKKRGIVLGSF